MPKAKKYDRVVLLESVGDFPKDAWGAVVEIYTTPYEAYDIEIMTDDGRTIGLADAVRPGQFDVKKLDSIPSGVHFQSVKIEKDGSYAIIGVSNGVQITVTKLFFQKEKFEQKK
ncbi:hypothetical protein FJZ31_32100 [Candidatus Poribacteria bacterium]|nr:hypothetical protein [Candidatus Poribacteria bacterium]